MADGATLVWGQATSSVTTVGWVTFQLHTPFYLPPNMNLIVKKKHKKTIEPFQILQKESEKRAAKNGIYDFFRIDTYTYRLFR